jgi:uncharacterized membrane protein YecN with MAPEG domain
MTIPVWVLLAFAVWTLLTLAATVGVYRWSRILGRKARIADFGYYRIEGEDWYKRALRAHANCVENLPVYGAVVVVAVVAGVDTSVLDVLALVLIAARVVHTLVHVLFEQMTVVVSFRSAFYNVQWACMFIMALVIAAAAA